jgi:ribose transport system permease protein
MGEGRARRRFEYERYSAWVALAVLVTVSALTSPYFLKTQNLLNILRQVSYTGIIAIGMTFVIAAGGIDLSVGSMTALAGGLSIVVLNLWGGGPAAVVLAALTAVAVGLTAGLVNGLLVTRGRVAPFIATLGTMAIYRSLTLHISQAGEFRSASSLYPAVGMGSALGVPIPVWVLLGLALLLGLVLHQTPFGRHVCAVGSNERVARYSGLGVESIRLGTYLIVGLTVGVSAMLLASRLNSVSSSNAGVSYELDAIAAAIIGGTSLAGGSGRIAGAVAGAVTLGVVNNMLNMWNVSPYLQGTVKGVVIIGAVLVQRARKLET